MTAFTPHAARIPPRPSEPFVDKGFTLLSALSSSAILGFVEYRLHRILHHALLFALSYIFWGFSQIGIDAPLIYNGNDEFIVYKDIKAIKENGWIGENHALSAPFGSSNFDFPLVYLEKVELLLSKIVLFFIEDIVMAANIQFLLTISICGITAFGVLRAFKVRRVWSGFGAILFALPPYISYRNITHLGLSACYFVPISILLCVWVCFDDTTYLVISTDFFKNKKNILTILFCYLIANNGIGYYQFFSCFFLCVVALYKMVVSRLFRKL